MDLFDEEPTGYVKAKIAENTKVNLLTEELSGKKKAQSPPEKDPTSLVGRSSRDQTYLFM